MSTRLQPDVGVAYQRRLTAAGPSLHTSISPSSSLPVTFELMRRSGYTVINVLRDGVWQRAAAFSPRGMNLIGLAVTSHDASALATGVHPRGRRRSDRPCRVIARSHAALG